MLKITKLGIFISPDLVDLTVGITNFVVLVSRQSDRRTSGESAKS